MAGEIQDDRVQELPHGARITGIPLVEVVVVVIAYTLLQKKKKTHINHKSAVYERKVGVPHGIS